MTTSNSQRLDDSSPLAPGSKAFYPRLGIGSIVGNAQHEGREYLKWARADGTNALVPVERVAASGLRQLVDCATAARWLGQLTEPLPAVQGEYAERLREQLELLERGRFEDNVASLRLAFVEHHRPLAPGDDGFGALKRYRDTRALVADELAAALSGDPQEMADEIDARLAEANSGS